MSAVAFCMDLILASLLLAALLVGVRLEKRLKVLRESHDSFVGAVVELNAAMAKAETGLAELKAASLDAESVLADRVQDAKGMTARLDKQLASAAETAERLEKALERYAALPMRELASARSRDFGHVPRSRESSDPSVLSLHMKVADRPSQPSPALRREALSREAPPAHRGEPRQRVDEPSQAGARSRAQVDEDLFEVVEPALRAARGMGR